MIEPDSFLSKFRADIDHDIFYGEVKEKQEAKQEYDTAKEEKQYGILISQPYKDIANLFEIKTNIKSKSKIKLNIQIEQYLKKKFNFNELKIEILRKFEMYNIKRNYRFISFKYDIRDSSGIYEVDVPTDNDIRIDRNMMDKYQCLVDGKIMCSKNNSSTNELTLKYKIMGEKADSYVLFDNKSNTFCHVISDIITRSVTKNENDLQEGYNDKVEGNILMPRRVIFVVDKSRSMNGIKWKKTIASAIMAVNKLRVGYDRYCFIFFNEYIEIFPQNGLIETNQDNIYECIKYLENNLTNGSTNINGALLKAIELIKNDIKLYKKNNNNFFVNQILLITNGEPTKSVKNTKEILLNVKQENILNDDEYFNKIAIFSFGIGTDNNNSSCIKDLNHSFLKLLSVNNNGFYCRIKESLADTKFNQYFNILSKPILSNINIQYQAKQIQKQYLTNTRFNTLYHGNDIIICGKINDTNALNGKELSITTSISAITAQEIKRNNKFITKPIKICTEIKGIINLDEVNQYNERAWAYLKLKQLEEIRLINNYNEEKHNDLSPVSFAMKYNFVTPWTSMVVVSHSDKKERITSLITIKKRRNGLKNGGYHRRMSLKATSSELQNGSKKFKNKTKLFVDTKHKNKILKITDFELKTTLGTGSFGRVRLVKYECEYFAMKMMRKSRIVQMKQENHIKSELKILRALNHPFIVNLIASFQDKNFLYLVLELVSGGEFFTLLKRAETLELAHCKFYGAQIVLIFQFLHHNKIVYRDLKPENLLIDVDGFLRLTDFGFAKKLNKAGGYRTWTLCGTPEYIAPEILLNRGHSFSVDWWSLGILLYEMFAGTPPFVDSNPMKVYQKILSCKIKWPLDKIKNNEHMIPKIGREFIQRLLTKNISQRIGNLEQRAVDVMKHRFFKGVNWKQMLEKSVEKVPWKPELKSKEDTKHFDNYEEHSDNDAEGQGLKNDPFLKHF